MSARNPVVPPEKIIEVGRANLRVCINTTIQPGRHRFPLRLDGDGLDSEGVVALGTLAFQRFVN